MTSLLKAVGDCFSKSPSVKPYEDAHISTLSLVFSSMNMNATGDAVALSQLGNNLQPDIPCSSLRQISSFM